VLEIPILQELRAECMREGALRGLRKSILLVLEARFGARALELEPSICALEFDQLDGVFKVAVTCRRLASFQKMLSTLSR
jgi:hypothetical protein